MFEFELEVRLFPTFLIYFLDWKCCHKWPNIKYNLKKKCQKFFVALVLIIGKIKNVNYRLVEIGDKIKVSIDSSMGLGP